MYYCKIKRGVTFTPSETTIEWNDDRLKDYREYSANLSDKSKELSFSEDGMPIIKTLVLDENGERYLIYNEDGTPDLIAIEAEKVANELSVKIVEAKAYLANTDYKMLPNYVPKPDEDLNAIIVKRNETREFIRNNNA